MTFRKRFITGGVLALAVAGVALHGAFAAAGEYAVDYLPDRQQESRGSACPSWQVLPYLHPQGLHPQDALALLCNAAHELPLALQMGEYGAADRSELMIAAWLHKGVPLAALGRVFSLYDSDFHGRRLSAFMLADAAHDSRFRIAWQLVFGREYPLRIELRHSEGRHVLDLRGEYRWQSGHTAPTLWLRMEDGSRQLRVADPLLSPDRLLTVEEWQAQHQAQGAVVLWGAIGTTPDPLVKFLPPAALGRLQRKLNLPAHHMDNADSINATLLALPQEMKPAFYAHVLGMEARAAHAPHRWHGHALTGDALPDWQEGNDAVNHRRYLAASQRLAPLLAYEALRAEQPDDEAFLRLVRARMNISGKPPPLVYIDFEEVQ